MKLRTAIALGFDDTVRAGKYLKVRCSQCQAAVVNGVPIHERTCPNEMHECCGCNAIIPCTRNNCEDCQ